MEIEILSGGSFCFDVVCLHKILPIPWNTQRKRHRYSHEHRHREFLLHIKYYS